MENVAWTGRSDRSPDDIGNRSSEPTPLAPEADPSNRYARQTSQNRKPVKNTRRAERFDFRLGVLFSSPYRVTQALTINVGALGLFIRTDQTREPNQVIRFSVVDPESTEHIDLVGIVAWTVHPTRGHTGRAPGMGVSLFGNNRDSMRRWGALLSRVAQWAGRGLDGPPARNTPSFPHPRPIETPPDTARRAHVRRPAKFNVTLRPEGIEELDQFKLKDISEGGTFVLTARLIPVGSHINLRLIHPETGDAFVIPGVVVRSIDSLDIAEKGIGIRFETEAVVWSEWDEFIARNAPRSDLIPRVVRRDTLESPDCAPPIQPGEICDASVDGSIDGHWTPPQSRTLDPPTSAPTALREDHVTPAVGTGPVLSRAREAQKTPLGLPPLPRPKS